MCLGDYARQARVAEEFIMVVGSYRVDARGAKRYVDVDARTVPARAWQDMLCYDGARAMAEELRPITNCRADDERWAAFRLKHSAAFDRQRAPGACVKLAMKRDSKAQKRIQCQMPDAAFHLFKRTFEPALTPVIPSMLKVPQAPPPADKYYTRPAGVARAVRELVAALGDELAHVRVVVEPAAGGGAFLAALAAAVSEGAEVLAYDIQPDPGVDIVELDFLQNTARVAADIAGRPAIVAGNPPMGGTPCSSSTAARPCRAWAASPSCSRARS